MRKLKFEAMFNQEEENYIKLKIDDAESIIPIEILSSIITDLGIDHVLDANPEFNTTATYKSWIGGHDFVEDVNYTIHIIFEEKYLHLIIKCTFENRKKLMKVLEKHIDFTDF